MDAQAGIQYEGEDQPEASTEDINAMRIYNMLSNGTGGLDWAGLPYAVGMYGVRDVEGLMHRLVVIKTHRRPEAS